jgi:hypothetical protein
MRLVRVASRLSPAVRFLALAALLVPAAVRAQIVRDHRTPSPAPAQAVALHAATSGELAKYSVESLHPNPAGLPLREPIVSLQVEFRCPTCASSASPKGVNVEIWFTGVGGSPKLVGVRYNVTLNGQGGVFSLPAGGIPAAEGAFVVKLIKDNEVSSSTFSAVPAGLKIVGPTVRDHRTQ